MNLQRRFIQYFESLPEIDPTRHNYTLIEELCNWYSRQLPGLFELGYARGSGVTTTLLNFAMWTHEKYIIVTTHPNEWEFHNFETTNWLRIPRFKRSQLVIMDTPLTLQQRESLSTMTKFNEWTKNINNPTFHAFQPYS